MNKRNSIEVGRTPCAYCSRPSEAISRSGQAVCFHHYMVADCGATPIKRAEHLSSRDDQLNELVEQHGDI